MSDNGYKTNTSCLSCEAGLGAPGRSQPQSICVWIVVAPGGRLLAGTVDMPLLSPAMIEIILSGDQAACNGWIADLSRSTVACMSGRWQPRDRTGHGWCTWQDRRRHRRRRGDG